MFGWPALIEKLLCWDLGLDDVALEALKLAVIREGAAGPVDPGLDLRLVQRAGNTLRFAWLDPMDGVQMAVLDVPEAAYVMVKGDNRAWDQLTRLLAGQMYVDIGRVLRSPVQALPLT